MMAQESTAAPSGQADPQQTEHGRRPIVAIDGPAGAGKSTVARHLSNRFGLLNLETGAMYRAFALKALAAGVSPDSADALVALAGTTSIVVEPGDAGNRVFLDGEEVTSRLRDAAITDGASRVSVHPRIRAWMVTLQQELGAQGGIVMEGRDIGTVVFPNADVKIFLDAEPEVRGLRRYDQLGGPNSKPVVQAEEVVRELRARDERDRNRADSPLKPAADSVILDSTELTLEQVLAEAAAIVEKKIKK